MIRLSRQGAAFQASRVSQSSPVSFCSGSRCSSFAATAENRLLGDGRDPKTDDVLHLVISFHREEDFNLLGMNEEARLSRVRETTRGTLKEMVDALNAEKLRSRRRHSSQH